MEQDILAKLEKQEARIEQIYVSVEKTRKYFLLTLIASAVMFVLPLIGLAFAIPAFLNTMMSAYTIQ